VKVSHPGKRSRPLPFYVKDFSIIPKLGYTEWDAKKENIEKTFDTRRSNRYELTIFSFIGSAWKRIPKGSALRTTNSLKHNMKNRTSYGKKQI